MNIVEVRKGGRVTRSHAEYTLHDETVAHHSANVALLCLRLHPGCSRQLLVRALTHDLAESFTGDVPATAKWDNEELAKELDNMEDAWFEANEVPRPDLWCDEDGHSEEEVVLHVADMLDYALRCLEELNMGNQYAKKGIRAAEAYLKDMGLPDELMATVEQIVREVKNAAIK